MGEVARGGHRLVCEPQYGGSAESLYPGRLPRARLDFGNRTDSADRGALYAELDD